MDRDSSYAIIIDMRFVNNRHRPGESEILHHEGTEYFIACIDNKPVSDEFLNHIIFNFKLPRGRVKKVIISRETKTIIKEFLDE